MELGEGLKGLPGPILVTGHTGFKGSWLMMLLNHLSIPAVGFSLPPEPESLYLRADLFGKNREHFGDIRDLSEVEKVFQMFAPSAVLHMAAQPLVLKSYEEPLETFDINIIGTANVLTTALATPEVKVIGVVTTDKVYKNENSGVSFRESDPLEGKDPYSASKVGTEAVVSAWRNISELNCGPQIISLRAGNVVGGGDFAENRLLPDLIRAQMNQESLVVRNPKSTRPWQHVLDPLCGYVSTLDKALSLKISNAYNFGPMAESLSVENVIGIAKELLGDSIQIVASDNPDHETNEAVALSINPSRAHEELGWEPLWTQEKAITMTLEWWDKVLNSGVSAIEACAHDIASIDRG